jgi:hypothetical protein
MKETAAQSAELKQRFKSHFRAHGYLSALPDDLQSERNDFPCEWAEACEEFEQEKGDHQ